MTTTTPQSAGAKPSVPPSVSAPALTSDERYAAAAERPGSVRLSLSRVLSKASKDRDRTWLR